MPRPCCCRRVAQMPIQLAFIPEGPCGGDPVVLSVDELEALRLCDQLRHQQAEAAESMGVSRATVGRILEQARAKVATALTEARAIRIEGGNYAMTDNPNPCCRKQTQIEIDADGSACRCRRRGCRR